MEKLNAEYCRKWVCWNCLNKILLCSAMGKLVNVNVNWIRIIGGKITERLNIINREQLTVSIVFIFRSKIVMLKWVVEVIRIKIASFHQPFFEVKNIDSRVMNLNWKHYYIYDKRQLITTGNLGKSIWRKKQYHSS